MGVFWFLFFQKCTCISIILRIDRVRRLLSLSAARISRRVTMALFDKEQFNTSVQLTALRIPAQACTYEFIVFSYYNWFNREYMRVFKEYLYVKPRVRHLKYII